MIKIIERLLGLQSKEEISPQITKATTYNENKKSNRIYLELQDKFSYMRISNSMGFYEENGEWKKEERCRPEYAIGLDMAIGGCGNKIEVSEYDLNVNCEIYTWQCKYCGMYHSICSTFIPERVKQRIRMRKENIHANRKVVNFEDYKRARY